MPRETIYIKNNWNEKLEVLKGWARDGLTDEQIAAKMGIHVSTLYEYKNKYPELNEALKKGKAVVDRKVESTLLKKALGYEVEETKKEAIYNKSTGQYEMKVTEIKTKHVNPDTTSIIFWLKNRKPEEWRDKSSKEISGPDGGPVQINDDLSTYSMEELKEMAGMCDD